MLVADAVGGVWDYALTLAGGLIQGGDARVVLVVVGPAPTEARVGSARAIAGLQLHVLDGRLEWMEGGQDWLGATRAGVARLAAEWAADVVHVNQLSLAGVGAEAPLSEAPHSPAVVLGVHSDVVTWWQWVKEGGKGPGTLPEYLHWQRELARDALPRANAVVCPSAFLAGEIARSYGLARAPHVIHNAVGPLPLPDPVPVREPHLAVVVGRAWDEAKNVAVVAEALRRCRRPWQVTVAGDTVEPGRAPSPPPAAHGLQYAGFLDKWQLAQLFGRAAVCLAPSSYEPFGLAAAEAALAGCAVVANDLPSYREIWGHAARYFARNDPQSLADTLDGLYDDPAAVRRLAAVARIRVQKHYTLDRMVAAYVALYRRLTGVDGRLPLPVGEGGGL
jgi:glycosyltransferase involved in cell wall biosynthesis